MKFKTMFSTVLLAGAGVLGYYYLQSIEPNGPPTMEQDGAANDGGIIVRTETTDWEEVLKSVIEQKASFLTMIVKEDRIRDQTLKKSIRYSPFPDSNARVRVKYHVEYPIGFDLRPGKFEIDGAPNGLMMTLRRPGLVASPSVKLQSYDILERGFLIDEKKALLELQQNIQPQAEQRARKIIDRPDVLPTSERALRNLLQVIMTSRAKPGELPPRIMFVYR